MWSFWVLEGRKGSSFWQVVGAVYVRVGTGFCREKHWHIFATTPERPAAFRSDRRYHALLSRSALHPPLTGPSALSIRSPDPSAHRLPGTVTPPVSLSQVPSSERARRRTSP